MFYGTNVVTFASDDTYSPPQTMRFATVIVIGGGGGGGGCLQGSAISGVAMGGRPGLTTIKYGVPRKQLAGSSITIGTGGAGGVGSAEGTAGGTTTLTLNGATDITAPGGPGGFRTTYGIRGETISGNPLSAVGAGGHMTVFGRRHGAACGGGTDRVNYTGGSGGQSFLGGDAAGRYVFSGSATSGDTATIPGAGGGGAGRWQSTSSATGGAGADGVVIIIENAPMCIGVQEFTSSGTYTKTNNRVKRVDIIVTGGGGAGGGCASLGATGYASGLGGQAGGTAFLFGQPIASVDGATVTIGAGGTASAGANGGAGGNSSVVLGGGVNVVGTGGAGGTASGSSPPVQQAVNQESGGTATGTGGHFYVSSKREHNGDRVGNLDQQKGGNGGDSYWGGDGGGKMQFTSGAGTGRAGTVYGCGGGGGCLHSTTGSTATGGDGADGVAYIIEWADPGAVTVSDWK